LEEAMKCTLCGSHEMRSTRRNVPYRSLPGTVLVDVEVWECLDCGDYEVVIPALNELERVLAGFVARKPGRLAPAEVRFLRKHLGWSGAHFARHFGVAPETVSRWENGTPMGPQAERLLRVCATRLDPIDDYEALAELLDRRGQEPKGGPLRVRHVELGWEVAD
jgi:putative zinc finger/helix-turn-helix YgiT family protein